MLRRVTHAQRTLVTLKSFGGWAGAQLPADEESSLPVQLVLGSLDLNVCDRFPSEDLNPLAFFPGEEGRAFISNVCVAPGARRNKIANQMVEATKEYCKANGSSKHNQT